MARLPAPTRAALLLGAACLFALARAEFKLPPDFNPQFCPNTISRQRIDPSMASDCKGIVVPWGMCRNCHMREHDARGEFVSNRDMYTMETPQCQRALRNYVRQNPCDGPRVQHITEYAKGLKGKLPAWRTKVMRRKLGEFMYNVCELCCDCVPIGLDRKRKLNAEYWTRRKQDDKTTGQNMLINVRRGNCPVHYYYDTCRMWPELRDIARKKKDLNLKLDRICWDHVYPWWNNPKRYRENWLRNPNATIPSKRFVDFLVKINNVLGCRNKRVWTDCARLELAQKRV